MANFIFNWATAALTAATLDLSTGNYYAHLVTTAPLLTNSTVSDLVLPTTSGYASSPLTGLSYNSTRWTFDSFDFPKYAFASAPTGVVICKRAGASPTSTDQIICYSDFNNSIGQTISLTAGVYVVNLQFGTNGAINFSNLYQYSSGVFANTESVPKGLIYLIGTRNNTQAFANPNPSKLLTLTTSAGTNVTSRVLAPGNQTSVNTIGVDLQTLSIIPGKIGVFTNNDTSAVTLTAFGSNNLPNGFATDWNNPIYFTNLGTITYPSNAGAFHLIPCSGSNRWRYFRINVAGTNRISQIEFYESSVYSSTANMI